MNVYILSSVIITVFLITLHNAPVEGSNSECLEMNSHTTVARTIKPAFILQGWLGVTQDMGSDTCCVVTASDCCTSVLYFHSHLQRNSRSEQLMLKSWCTTRQIMFWSVYRSSGGLASRYRGPDIRASLSLVGRDCIWTCKIIALQSLKCWNIIFIS